MKPPLFDYHRPESIDQALACLAELEDVKLLAGGQSLMPMMNFRYVAPLHVVDLNRVAELVGITVTGGALVLGAMTRQRDLLDSRLVNQHCPLMIDALKHVGHLQTRNRGTIGGSLSHLDPAAELPAVLAACNAVLDVKGPNGDREVDIAQWSLGYMTPNLQPDELLCRIRIPVCVPGTGHAFHEVARRLGDFAMAGAGALVRLDEGGKVEWAAIALNGVDVCPVRLVAGESALIGQVPSPANIETAARHALDVAGLDDVHATAVYRRKVAVAMTRRAVRDAAALASGREAVR